MPGDARGKEAWLDRFQIGLALRKLPRRPLIIIRPSGRASFVWSWREESNLQPSVYKTGALPLSYASILPPLTITVVGPSTSLSVLAALEMKPMKKTVED